MTINEKDRLDLRQALEALFENQRIAEIAMEAMPPVDYANLATKQDVAACKAELKAEMVQLRGEFAELRGELRGEFGELRGEFGELRGEFGGLKGDVARLDAKIDAKIAEQLRVSVLTALTTMVMLGGYITAVLG